MIKRHSIKSLLEMGNDEKMDTVSVASSALGPTVATRLSMTSDNPNAQNILNSTAELQRKRAESSVAVPLNNEQKEDKTEKAKDYYKELGKYKEEAQKIVDPDPKKIEKVREQTNKNVEKLSESSGDQRIVDFDYFLENLVGSNLLKHLHQVNRVAHRAITTRLKRVYNLSIEYRTNVKIGVTPPDVEYGYYRKIYNQFLTVHKFCQENERTIPGEFINIINSVEETMRKKMEQMRASAGDV